MEGLSLKKIDLAEGLPAATPEQYVTIVRNICFLSINFNMLLGISDFFVLKA